MTNKDFNRGYEKRQRIGETTLIVGLDIGCEYNMMCLMNSKGKVLGEHKVYNSRKGFEFFKSVVNGVAKRERLWDVLVGFESGDIAWRIRGSRQLSECKAGCKICGLRPFWQGIRKARRQTQDLEKRTLAVEKGGVSDEHACCPFHTGV